MVTKKVGSGATYLHSDPAFAFWRVNLGEVNPSPPDSEKKF